jgi:poly(A) polymerase
MKVTGDWLMAAGTQAVCAALGRAGHQALFVGGAVRNALLGLPVADVDIATDAGPGRVTAIAEAAGFRVIPTGIDHGTVTVIADGRLHEVTTFRRDVATDGRHAVVAFTDDLAADAARRDLTMNALYAAPDGTVIDPLGAVPDLLAGRVRFVGDAARRIAEDHLRILRFFRFHAWYGDPAQGLDAEGLAACAAGAAGTEALSRERVGAEIRKLLAAADPAPAVAAMAQSGVLARVLPGAEARMLPVLIHLEGDEPIRWQRRLAALGGPDATDALRLSRTEAMEIGHIRAALSTTDRIAALAYRHGEAVARDVALLRAAALEQPPVPHWQADAARGAVAICPVGAADLMPGLQGAALGARLKAIEARWLASDLVATREELLKI